MQNRAPLSLYKETITDKDLTDTRALTYCSWIINTTVTAPFPFVRINQIIGAVPRLYTETVLFSRSALIDRWSFPLVYRLICKGRFSFICLIFCQLLLVVSLAPWHNVAVVKDGLSFHFISRRGLQLLSLSAIGRLLLFLLALWQQILLRALIINSKMPNALRDTKGHANRNSINIWFLMCNPVNKGLMFWA